MPDFVVDFESYYSKKESVSAGTVGVKNYVRDSYAYMVSVVGPGTEFIGSIEEAQVKFPDAFWEAPENRFWAANANFDELWVRRYWPDAKTMKPWHCILDRGAPQQLPQSLSGIAKALWGKKVDKTIRDWMDGKHFRDLTPEQQKEVLDYCLSDAKEEQHVLQTLPDPTPVEDQIAAHTRMCNLRGVRIDTERLKADREALLRFQHEAFLRIPWRNDEAPLSPLALAQWAQGEGLPVPASLAKDDEECAELVDAHPKLAAVVTAMRQFRKANTLVRKIESLESRLDESGTLPLELMYCGARHTRRWSSRGVNVQNLDREPYYLTPDGKPAEGSWDVWPRRWIIPRPGMTFVILDYAQIEPRCLNWLVGNDSLLEMIRQGFGIYEAYARVSGQWKDPAPLKKANPHLYKSVKAQVLGLGYGMGAGRYKETAAKDGIVLTDAEAKATVATWRGLNKPIVDFWGQMDSAIKEATIDRAKLLEIQMPTGDFLRHFRVTAFSKTFEDPDSGEKVTKRGYESFTTKADFTPMSKQPNLWGGTMCENCLAGDTEVLTETRGWVPLRDVHWTDRVFDGVDFVLHDGLVHKGRQEVINLHGMRVTPDHLFLCGGEWVPALQLSHAKEKAVHTAPLESIQSDRAILRGVDSSDVYRIKRKTHGVGGGLSMRRQDSQDNEGHGESPILRKNVPGVCGYGGEGTAVTRDDASPGLRGVAFDASALFRRKPSGLPQLRRAWDRGLRAVGKFLDVLGGHGSDVEEGTGFGPGRQQQGVLTSELSVGRSKDKRSEQTSSDDAGLGSGCRRQERSSQVDVVLSSVERDPVGGGRHVEEVYDIVNCGPRNRFVVRPAGADYFLIAHNCTQRMARDVLAEAVLRLESAGLPVVFHAHDEVILEVPIASKEDAKRSAEEIMRVAPAWAPDLPLGVEGDFADTYVK